MFVYVYSIICAYICICLQSTDSINNNVRSKIENINCLYFGDEKYYLLYILRKNLDLLNIISGVFNAVFTFLYDM